MRETAYQRRYRLRREAGICVRCGKPANEGRAHCPACREAAAASSLHRARTRRAAGLCWLCAEPVVEGHTLCPGHFAEMQAHCAELRGQRAAAPRTLRGLGRR